MNKLAKECSKVVLLKRATIDGAINSMGDDGHIETQCCSFVKGGRLVYVKENKIV